MGILLKYRFRCGKSEMGPDSAFLRGSGKSEMGPRFCVSNRLRGDVDAAGLGGTH